MRVIIFSHIGSQRRGLWGSLSARCPVGTLTGKDARVSLRVWRALAPQRVTSSGEHRSHKAETVFSYSERHSSDMVVSSLILGASLSWDSPCLPQVVPLLLCALIHGHTLRRHLPILPLHTAIVSKEKNGLNQGSILRKRKDPLCTKFLWSYILQFPLPTVSSNKAHNHRYTFLPKVSYYFSLFLKKKANDALVQRIS